MAETLENLIKTLNAKTNMRVEITYNVNNCKEGYQAGYFAFPESIIKDFYDTPWEAIKKLKEFKFS